MPASTAVYGITYPCGGDTIDADVFATFASSLDAALTQGAADIAEATERPNAQVQGPFTSQSVTVNVATTLTYIDEIYDNDAMADLTVNNDRLTVQESGAYLVWGGYSLSGFTTLSSLAVILLVNGIERGRHKSRAPSFSGDGQVDLTMPMSLVAGDFIQAQALWTGTGGPATAQPRILSASFIAAP